MTQKNIFIIATVVLIAIFIATFVMYFYPKNNPSKKPGRSPIAIGVLTSDAEAIAKYQALADYLNIYSGDIWYIEPVKDQGSFIEQIENHKIKSAFVGSAAGYRIIKNGLGLPLVRGEKDGVSTYDANIIVRKDSGISSIDGLKDKRFAYVDIGTSSGYFFPVYLLRTKGLDEDNFFRAASFLMTDERVIDAVLSRRFDGGAINNLALFDAIKKNPDIQNELEVIAEDGPYPHNIFMISVDMDEKRQNQIQAIFLDMTDSDQGKKILEILDLDRFIKTYTKDFVEAEKYQNL